MITAHSALYLVGIGARLVVPGSVQLIQAMGYSVLGSNTLMYYVNALGSGWVGLSA